MQRRETRHQPLMMDQSWDGLKREARQLESLLDHRIQAYGSAPAPSAQADRSAHRDEEAGLGGTVSATDAEVTAGKEIEESLDRFLVVTERLGQLLAERPSRANSATVQRYREVLHDFKAAYRRQQAASRAKRDSAALFHSLRGPGGGGDTSATDALLRERGSLMSSSKALDAVLAQAAETRDALSRQRAGILTAAGRLGGIAASIPGVSQLMGAIDSRRSRNDSIVALVAAGIICFMLWWFALRKT